MIGYERSERLDVKPAEYIVVVTRREKRACKGCADGVSTAPLPERVVEKGLVSDRFVINTLVSKYSDLLAAVPSKRDSGAGCGRLDQ